MRHLILTGSNGYTGGTTISGGTLQLGDGTAGHDGSVAAAGGIVNNADLIYNLNGSQTYSGAIGGSGNIDQKRRWVANPLATNSTYTGVTTVNSGALVVTNTGALPGYNSTSSLAVNSGGMLTLTVGGTPGWAAADVGNLVTANSGGFATGSILGIDTTPSRDERLFLSELHFRQHGPDKAGPECLDSRHKRHLWREYHDQQRNPATGQLLGPTAEHAGHQQLGILSFGSLASATFGGLTGPGILTLSDTAYAVALSVGRNNANTTVSGALRGLQDFKDATPGTLISTRCRTAGPGGAISAWARCNLRRDHRP